MVGVVKCDWCGVVERHFTSRSLSGHSHEHDFKTRETSKTHVKPQ